MAGEIDAPLGEDGVGRNAEAGEDNATRDVTDVVEIGPGEDGDDAGEGEGGGRVNAVDASGGVRTADDGREVHVGKFDVVEISGGAGHHARVFFAFDPLADVSGRFGSYWAHSSLPFLYGRGGTDGIYDVLIAGAAAEIAFQGVSNFGVGGVGIALDQLEGGHDHSRGAEATLQAVLFPEALLHRMKFAEGCDSFDRDDIATVALDGEHRARFDGESIDGDGAGTTERGFAAAVRAGEKKRVAEEMDEEKPGFDFSGVLASIDGNGDLVLQSKRPFRTYG